jgi:hypothetical protein
MRVAPLAPGFVRDDCDKDILKNSAVRIHVGGLDVARARFRPRPGRHCGTGQACQRRP